MGILSVALSWLMNESEMTEQAQRLQEQAQDWKEQAQNWSRNAMETARNAGQAMDGYARENVWTTVALGVMVGCVIGFMLARTRD